MKIAKIRSTCEWRNNFSCPDACKAKLSLNRIRKNFSLLRDSCVLDIILSLCLAETDVL